MDKDTAMWKEGVRVRSFMEAQELSNDWQITKLVTKGCHHKNLSIIFILLITSFLFLFFIFLCCTQIDNHFTTTLY